MYALMALSPLDGRYRTESQELTAYFSESALIRARIQVEIEWLIEQGETPAIAHLEPLSNATTARIRAIVDHFGLGDAERVKAIETSTRHDVKAVEYFLAERLGALGLEHLRPYLHFGCTSEDISNLAYGMLLRDALREVWLPTAGKMADAVARRAVASSDAALLSLTHGQPATPTTLGKELAVFVSRWCAALERVRAIPVEGKFNGATGTYGAHAVAYPDAPWPAISQAFVERLGLRWNPLTTQIEPHDRVAEILHAVAHFNTTLIDFSADMWNYVSRGVVSQRRVAGAVGSSVMPHKLNPIHFENAEANAGLSIAVCEHLARSLPISRLQRDLADSSRMRNVGVALGYSLVAIRAVAAGVEKLEPDRKHMLAELDGAAAVLAEPVQTVLRKHGAQDAYERLATFVREGVSLEELRDFVAATALPDADRQRLLELTPASYTGLAAALAIEACQSIDLFENDLVVQ